MDATMTFKFFARPHLSEQSTVSLQLVGKSLLGQL